MFNVIKPVSTPYSELVKLKVKLKYLKLKIKIGLGTKEEISRIEKRIVELEEINRRFPPWSIHN